VALSNWDTMAINERCESIDGYWESPAGVGIGIYKNRLHIHDKKTWEDNDYQYSEPIIMMIQEGVLDYKDIHMVALRGPQGGIYVMVWHHEYRDDYSTKITTGMIGIGCYGFEGEEFVGVTPDSIKWLSNEMNAQHEETSTMSSSTGPNGEWEDEEFTSTYHDIDIPDEFRKLDLSKAIRFNQGDAYFADKIDSDLQATEPGKAKNTMMSKILDDKEV